MRQVVAQAIAVPMAFALCLGGINVGVPAVGDRRHQRHAHGEGAAAAGPAALRLDRAAVQLDETPGERQSDPEPALPAIAKLLHLSKIRANMFGGIPSPVSVTATTAEPPSAAALTRI